MGLFGKLAGPQFKIVLPLAKNLLTPLAKSTLVLLKLLAAESAVRAGIHKYFFESKARGSRAATLIISDEEMEYIIKVFGSLENSEFLIKGAAKTIKRNAKEQKGKFLCMLIGTSGASLLENILAGNGTICAGE